MRKAAVRMRYGATERDRPETSKSNLDVFWPAHNSPINPDHDKQTLRRNANLENYFIAGKATAVAIRAANRLPVLMTEWMDCHDRRAATPGGLLCARLRAVPAGTSCRVEGPRYRQRYPYLDRQRHCAGEIRSSGCEPTPRPGRAYRGGPRCPRSPSPRWRCGWHPSVRPVRQRKGKSLRHLARRPHRFSHTGFAVPMPLNQRTAVALI